MRKQFKNITEAIEKTSGDGKTYKLCYIDSIPETILDYTESSKAYMNSPEYDEAKSIERYNYYDPHIVMTNIPNPEYDSETSTHYAYFTSDLLQDQWGDDWNDSPYEHNAGEPYDHDTDRFGSEVIILEVPFGICSDKVYDLRFPCDYGINSPWSVEEINLGAIPWIFARPERKKSVIINAGVDLSEFKNKLEEIQNQYGE